MQVERTVTIQCDAQKIVSLLTNFHHWKQWSPWLLMEPDARVIVSDDARIHGKGKWHDPRSDSTTQSIPIAPFWPVSAFGKRMVHSL